MVETQSQPVLFGLEPPRPPVDEVAYLRQLLATQMEATERALGTAQELKKKLSEAHNAQEKMEIQWLTTPAGKAAEAARAQSQQYKTQWERTQKDLEREQSVRFAEASQAATKMGDLKRKLELAEKENHSRRHGKQMGGKRIIGILAGTLGVCVLVALCTVPLFRFPPKTELHNHATSSSRPVFSSPALVSTAHGEFTAAISRLDRALASFPAQSSEKVIRAANEKSHACPIEWNGGQPQILYNASNGNALSLAATMEKCADAVEQLR